LLGVDRSPARLDHGVKPAPKGRKVNRGLRVQLDQRAKPVYPGSVAPPVRTVSCEEGETLVSVVCSIGASNGVTCPEATQTTGLCLRQ
jgi:hypothetical protein